jgi:hypothetical protein
MNHDHIDQMGTEEMEAARGYMRAQEHLSAAGEGREASSWVDEMRDTEVLEWMDSGGYPGGAAGFREANGL